MIIPAPYTGAEPITANFGQNKSGMVSRSVVREIRRTADLNPPGFHRLPKNRESGRFGRTFLGSATGSLRAARRIVFFCYLWDLQTIIPHG